MAGTRANEYKFLIDGDKPFQMDRRNADWRAICWAAMEYTPNKTQQPYVMDFIAGARLQALCGGERSGKSRTAAACAILDMGPRTSEFATESERRFWIVGPDYRQARPEFIYIHDAFSKLGYVESASMPDSDTQPWTMRTKWNTVLQTRSSGKEERLASYTVHGVLLAEASQQSRGVLDKMFGRVSETLGWIMLVGTLENAYPWYADLIRNWEDGDPINGKSYSIPTWSNTAIYPGGMENPEIKRLRQMLPDDYFMERFGAKPRRNRNLVIPEFDKTLHIVAVKPEVEAPIELAIDPGTHCYSVLFVQTVGPFTYVLDEIYEHGAIIDDIIKKVKSHPYYPLIRRNVDSFHGSIDFAGRQHSGGADSQVDIWRKQGLRLFTQYRKLNDSILVVRQRLRINPTHQRPLVLFSSNLKAGMAGDKPAGIIGEFGMWRWQKQTAGSGVKQEPVDRYNDGIKALAYYLLWKHGLDKGTDGPVFGSVRPSGWSAPGENSVRALFRARRSFNREGIRED